jgi:hypothetical protein
MGTRQEGEAFRSHWIAHPISALFPGVDPARPDLTIEVRCADQPMTVQVAEGRVAVHPGPSAAPDLVLTGPPDATVGLIARRIEPADARSRSLAITGDPELLRRLEPAVPAAAPVG